MTMTFSLLGIDFHSSPLLAKYLWVELHPLQPWEQQNTFLSINEGLEAELNSQGSTVEYCFHRKECFFTYMLTFLGHICPILVFVCSRNILLSVVIDTCSEEIGYCFNLCAMYYSTIFTVKRGGQVGFLSCICEL